MEYHTYIDKEKEKFPDEPSTLLKLRKNKEEFMDGLFSLFTKGSVAQQAYVEEQIIEKIGNKELARNRLLSLNWAVPGVNYPESPTLPNVTIVYREIKEITPQGCLTANGRPWPLDVLICATSFDTTCNRQGHRPLALQQSALH
ncbi:hypothetical protein BHE90_000979 [Fusarium euwallaceae]|uniref:Uncharacterized protein n=2 Tax=Fusarium solani species complex TaxID=232080 RepID=A0A3M2S9K1_9HYPO|nr:hypothetical protein CDV36_006085 [Fusarium kuroshium]RTE84362.1 hypothetical protein BHE90_000979 [Fusarium euwallaceae]